MQKKNWKVYNMFQIALAGDIREHSWLMLFLGVRGGKRGSWRIRVENVCVSFKIQSYLFPLPLLMLHLKKFIFLMIIQRCFLYFFSFLFSFDHALFAFDYSLFLLIIHCLVLSFIVSFWLLVISFHHSLILLIIHYLLLIMHCFFVIIYCFHGFLWSCIVSLFISHGFPFDHSLLLLIFHCFFWLPIVSFWSFIASFDHSLFVLNIHCFFWLFIVFLWSFTFFFWSLLFCFDHALFPVIMHCFSWDQSWFFFLSFVISFWSSSTCWGQSTWECPAKIFRRWGILCWS